jgi:hypothetical protein
MAIGDDVRRERGRLIAEACKLNKRSNGMWFVPSQSAGGHYAVRLDPNLPTCSCPDYELRGMKCKHIYAVEYSLKRQENADGSTTTTQTVTVTQPAPKRPTYKQLWPAYNKAQTNEKDKFQMLLADLCGRIVDDTPRTKGQPRIPLADAIFACCF